MVYDINAPLGPSLDISCDTLTRTSWDDMVDDTRVLETLDKYTRIEYVRAKAVFPTAARDVVLLSHLAAYPLDWAGEGQPTSFIHVTKSVDHARAPKPKGVVRMSTSVAGRLFTPLPNGGTRSLQIADLNPGGNVPAWVVNFVASKAVPKSVGTMYARMKQVGWTANQPSKMWEEGLAGKDWTPRARGKDEAAVEQPAVEALAPVEDKEERGGVLSAVGSAIVAVGSAAGSAVQGVHDALAWSSPFLLTAAAVAVAIAARDGGIKVEIGPRRR